MAKIQWYKAWIVGQHHNHNTTLSNEYLWHLIIIYINIMNVWLYERFRAKALLWEALSETKTYFFVKDIHSIHSFHTIYAFGTGVWTAIRSHWYSIAEHSILWLKHWYGSGGNAFALVSPIAAILWHICRRFAVELWEGSPKSANIWPPVEVTIKIVILSSRRDVKLNTHTVWVSNS